MAVQRYLPAIIATLTLALLAGCGTTTLPARDTPPRPARQEAIELPTQELPALPAAGSGRGGYYQDDGPGELPPTRLREVPDAVVKAEPLSRYANRPYSVFGKGYTPITHEKPFRQRGVSSWYGKKFHGQKTSSGEVYDMYKMTAAHPTLPIPSYARITNVSSGSSVVVRINDRGPFHAGRIVDVSYTAALKLGLLTRGSHEVELERLLPNGRRDEPEPDAAPADIAALMLDSKTERRAEKKAVLELDDAPVPRTTSAGFYVQLGAFARAEKAAEIRTRMAGIGVLGDMLNVIPGALHRVLGGPFATRDEAQQALRDVPAALGLRPIVVKR
ncbi:MAG: septal ring lytic transglycosylase RlpA family protein [Pseudomonadota bacterium]